MPTFQVEAPFIPTGDQPQAIEKLVAGINAGYKHQTLLGATATGKTYVMSKLIEAVNRPTLVLAHNKTLAAQLYQEFKDFLPNNAVEYFVSYYDFYQPEAYIPRTDLYIEKDADINEEIDKLRHAATRALFERKDVVIVASVSCIFGLGSPEEYGKTLLNVRRGQTMKRNSILRRLIDIHYTRNDQSLVRGNFRVRGDTLKSCPRTKTSPSVSSSGGTRWSASLNSTLSRAKCCWRGPRPTSTRPSTSSPLRTSWSRRYATSKMSLWRG